MTLGHRSSFDACPERSPGAARSYRPVGAQKTVLITAAISVRHPRGTPPLLPACSPPPSPLMLRPS
ncbi:hypothetical protein D187_006650 [Cystobacter fuscus DSM 2262]|uniref:Uncharacterized protein n=1 Tax=Cystobacter fuscus (strain ATCC 25194 / DSM 2262 / NBRC 100088 / M29) TaxID=1242864 RepID=S9NZ23_CYSF2|nr:hypothetical protein D187_006650 [Cystobacter fuscus DSM 2262]